MPKKSIMSSGSYTTTSGQMDVGTHYFYCSIGNHCSSGMYVTVNVVSAPIPIPSASWHAFVSECLAIAPVDGLCTTWDKFDTYGAMPNWDVSLVEDMSGYDGSLNALAVKVHSTVTLGVGIQHK